MVKTGMTRRIDELGRLVIPKEIRNNLRIKDNDQVEITVIDNKIVLCKYDSLNSDETIITLINCLKKSISKNILFTNREKIIERALINKDKFNIELNEELMNIIENRKEIVNISRNNLIISVFPLIVNGDLYGSLIVYGDSEISNNELNIIRFSKMFLENYLE